MSRPEVEEWAEALRELLHLGTSGRYFLDYGHSAHDLAEALAPLIARTEQAAREEGMAAVAAVLLPMAREWDEESVAWRDPPRGARVEVEQALARAGATEALARVRAEAKAEERERLVRMFETEAAEAWGGDASWMTTGRHVAELAACWINDADDTTDPEERP